MTTKKSKTPAKSTRTRTSSSKTAARTEKTVTTADKKGCMAGFFARKYDEKEGISTVFKTPKFYGALLGELLGTMMVAVLLFSLSMMGGVYSLAVSATSVVGIFALIAIMIGAYAFSGACLNPIVTVGMMASRRMSVIRGVMYIIAEIVGAWLGWLLFSGFMTMGGENAVVESVASLTAVAEGGFWLVALVEFIGALIIAFFYARAVEYKRSVFTFAAVAVGGFVLAIFIGYILSAAFFGLNNNFVFNPAAALMMQIFPQSGSSFGEILGGICQALSIYVLIPMIGGVIGFYISDFVRKLSED